MPDQPPLKFPAHDLTTPLQRAAEPPAVVHGIRLEPHNGRGARGHAMPTWLLYIGLFLKFQVGLWVFCLPWFPSVWDANPLFAQSAWLSSFVTQGAVRGIVSGLGLLNLSFALRESLRNPTDVSR